MDVFFEQLFLLGITTKATRGIIPSSDLLSACGRINSIPPKCYDIWWLSMQLQALSNAGHRPTRPIARLLGVRNAKCLERKNGCGLAMVSANVFQVIRFRPSKFKELASSEHREKTCPPLRFFWRYRVDEFPGSPRVGYHVTHLVIA